MTESNGGCLSDVLKLLLIIILLPLAVGTCAVCGGTAIVAKETAESSDGPSSLYELLEED